MRRSLNIAIFTLLLISVHAAPVEKSQSPAKPAKEEGAKVRAPVVKGTEDKENILPEIKKDSMIVEKIKKVESVPQYYIAADSVAPITVASEVKPSLNMKDLKKPNVPAISSVKAPEISEEVKKVHNSLEAEIPKTLFYSPIEEVKKPVEKPVKVDEKKVQSPVLSEEKKVEKPVVKEDEKKKLVHSPVTEDKVETPMKAKSPVVEEVMKVDDSKIKVDDKKVAKSPVVQEMKQKEEPIKDEKIESVVKVAKSPEVQDGNKTAKPDKMVEGSVKKTEEKKEAKSPTVKEEKKTGESKVEEKKIVKAPEVEERKKIENPIKEEVKKIDKVDGEVSPPKFYDSNEVKKEDQKIVADAIKVDDKNKVLDSAAEVKKYAPSEEGKKVDQKKIVLSPAVDDAKKVEVPVVKSGDKKVEHSPVADEIKKVTVKTESDVVKDGKVPVGVAKSPEMKVEKTTVEKDAERKESEKQKSPAADEKKADKVAVKDIEKKVESPVIDGKDTKITGSVMVSADKWSKEKVSHHYATAESKEKPAKESDKKVSEIGAQGEVKDEAGKDSLTYLSEPINQATKLLMDLDEHIKSYLSTSETSSTLLPQSYGVHSESSASQPPAAAQPTRQDQQEQLAPMITQLDTTITAMDDQIQTMMANRRYMTAAMVRSMRTYLRNVRDSMVRLQNRLRAFQAAATSVGQPSQPVGTDVNETPVGSTGIGFPNNVFFESLRDRINRITSDITNLMYRMSQSMTASSTAQP